MKRIITEDGKVLFIPSPGVRKMTASDVLMKAFKATTDYTNMTPRRMWIATGLEKPDSILDLNNAVKDLREIHYQTRIEAQALNIHLPLYTIHEEGMYVDMPENHERPKLERMVNGLRQVVSDMVDDIELSLSLR